MNNFRAHGSYLDEYAVGIPKRLVGTRRRESKLFSNLIPDAPPGWEFTKGNKEWWILSKPGKDGRWRVVYLHDEWWYLYSLTDTAARVLAGKVRELWKGLRPGSGPTLPEGLEEVTNAKE